MRGVWTQVASLPDRGHVVVEIWNDDTQLAEVSHEEPGPLLVELFASIESIPLDDLAAALAVAKAELER